MFLATVLGGLVSWVVSSRKPVDWSGELRVVGNRVWLGERRLPRFQFAWSSRLNQAVYASYAKRTHLAAEALRELRFSGWHQSEEAAYLVGIAKLFQLNQGAGHLLVIGPTGSGKSELLHLALASLSSGVDVALADYKGGALNTEARVRRSTSDIAPNQLEFWKSLDEELDVRQVRLQSDGVPSWEALERIDQGAPRLLVIIDEVVAAIRSFPKAHDVLVRIASKGRSLGVHLLITTQSLVGLPREVLVNLRSRLALAGTDEVELLQLGIKHQFPQGSEQTKAAVLSHDGQTYDLQVPLGARRAPRPVA